MFHFFKCIALSVFFFFPLARHPYHVSVCDIQHSSKSRSLEITLRIFTDDLEDGLEKKFHTSLDLTQIQNKAISDSLVSAYVLKNLIVSTDKKQRKLSYLGYECSNDATIIYVECSKTSQFKEIGINCQLLTEIFEDQTNLVHVKHLGQLKSMRLTGSEMSGSLLFK